jgi:hypothetical protein
MMRARTAAVLKAMFALRVVLAVPVFAQAGTPSLSPVPFIASDIELTRTGVMRPLAAEAPSHAGLSVPPNLIVPPVFRNLVNAMLRGSSTFRRQCARIANAPGMVVELDWSVPRGANRARARTTMSTAADGRRYAAVTIQAGDDAVELIAHELEHVLEQLDDVDLRTLATVPSSRVHACECGEQTFETARAVRAGRTVAAELRRHRS